MDNVLEKFLDAYSVVSDNALKQLEDNESSEDEGDNENQQETGDSDDDEKDETPILDQVHVGTIAEFIFDLGSDPATNDKYRKPLYDMHKKYMRRLKQVGRDVAIEEDQDVDDENEMAMMDDDDNVDYAEMEEEAQDETDISYFYF